MNPKSKLIKILVVDDEQIISTTLATILRQSGFDAVAYTDPLKALAAIEDGIPDLIISDVKMPGITGVELAIKITEACPDCKILLFSGQASTADLLASASAGGHDFQLLTKPVHPSDLLVAIRSKLNPSEALAHRVV